MLGIGKRSRSAGMAPDREAASPSKKKRVEQAGSLLLSSDDEFEDGLMEAMREYETSARKERYSAVSDRARELSGYCSTHFSLMNPFNVAPHIQPAADGYVLRRQIPPDGVVQGGIVMGVDDGYGSQYVCPMTHLSPMVNLSRSSP